MNQRCTDYNIIMKINDSSHERAALVATAWIIGLVTSYIAFGIEYPVYVAEIDLPTDYSSNTEETVGEEPDETEVNDNLRVENDSDGLFAVFNGNTRILSASVASFDTPTATGPGYHYSIPDSIVSPNELFVYFCEQEVQAATTCLPYIYSTLDDSVRLIKTDEPVTINDKARWQADGILQIGSTYTSTSGITPWK